MADFNFADIYRAAGLTPGPEIINLRQSPIEKLLETFDANLAINLARIYYGLTLPEGTDWFRDAFGETDPSFSMLENEREAAVLAACILSGSITNNQSGVAALVVLTMSTCGLRQPIVFPELVETARKSLITIAVDTRAQIPLSQHIGNVSTKINIDKESEDLIAGPDWQKITNIAKKIASDSSKTTTKLANQTNAILNTLNTLINFSSGLQEEVEMLWWHIGGWSRILDRPFTELEPGMVAVMAGLDLADLSQSTVGPAAATAILHRTVMAGCAGKSNKVSIQDAVKAFPIEEFEKLSLISELSKFSDLCPVLTGFQKAHEVGESPAWEQAFERAAYFKTSEVFDLTEFAVQVYRERSLLAAIYPSQ